jgi:hypothetical protein
VDALVPSTIDTDEPGLRLMTCAGPPLNTLSFRGVAVPEPAALGLLGFAAR